MSSFGQAGSIIGNAIGSYFGPVGGAIGCAIGGSQGEHCDELQGVSVDLRETE